MKYIISLLFSVLFFTAPTWAETQKLCDSIAHVPDDDVIYRPSPGIVPADLNAVPIELGEVEIPLTAFLVQELDLNIPISSSKLGSVIVKENGSVLYNGQDISNQVQAVCATSSKKIEVLSQEPQNQDGQVRVEAVKSQKLEPLQKQQEKMLYGSFGQDHINKSYNN